MDLSLLFDYWCGATMIVFAYNIKEPLFEKFGLQETILIMLFGWLMVPVMTLPAIMDVLENGFITAKEVAEKKNEKSSS